jgi:kinesin family member C2/C3
LKNALNDVPFIETAAIEELKGKIRVYCRLRPLSSTEKQASGGQPSVADVVDPYTLVIRNGRCGDREFHFDRIFLPEDSQHAVFEDTHVS